MDRAVGAAVRFELVRDHHQRPAVVALAGRPDALGPAAEGQHLGLVHRAPPVHLAAELAGAEARERDEARDGLGVLPAAPIGDPQRVGEVVERDERREPAPAQRAEHRVVVGDLGGIEAVGRGLDPAPLERQAVHAVPVGGGQRPVLVEALVVEAGVAAGTAVARGAGSLLEAPPVVEPVAALDLVRRRGGPPPEAIRKAADHGAAP